MQCFEASARLADDGAVLLHRCSILKLVLNSAVQAQCVEASAPLADAGGDILLHWCNVLKLRPLG